MEKRKGFASPFLLIYSKFHKKKEKSLKKKNQSGEERFQQSPRKSRFDPLSRKAITIIPIARINIESVVIGRAITGREMIVPILETLFLPIREGGGGGFHGTVDFSRKSSSRLQLNVGVHRARLIDQLATLRHTIGRRATETGYAQSSRS